MGGALRGKRGREVRGMMTMMMRGMRVGRKRMLGFCSVSPPLSFSYAFVLRVFVIVDPI